MDPVADLLARGAATLAASDDLDASVGALLELATADARVVRSRRSPSRTPTGPSSRSP